MDADPKELEEKKNMVLNMCTCKQCPSFKECGEVIGYCFPTIGKSNCIKDENGCICGNCPVTTQLDLKQGYYCTRDSEKEQSGE
jgi:hypothetical protein